MPITKQEKKKDDFSSVDETRPPLQKYYWIESRDCAVCRNALSIAERKFLIKRCRKLGLIEHADELEKETEELIDQLLPEDDEVWVKSTDEKQEKQAHEEHKAGEAKLAHADRLKDIANRMKPWIAKERAKGRPESELTVGNFLAETGDTAGT